MKTQIQDSPHMDDKPFDDNSTGFMWKKEHCQTVMQRDHAWKVCVFYPRMH